MNATASSIEVIGGTTTFQRLVRGAIEKYPAWFVRSARISKVIITNRPDIREQIAAYEHGVRTLSVWPGVGDMLQKAIGHELAHAVDDNFDQPHFFTSTPEWQKIHKQASSFDLPKYEAEPLEYFADIVTKLFLLGPQRLQTTNPRETTFVTSWVFPLLQKEFGK